MRPSQLAALPARHAQISSRRDSLGFSLAGALRPARTALFLVLPFVQVALLFLDFVIALGGLDRALAMHLELFLVAKADVPDVLAKIRPRILRQDLNSRLLGLRQV